MLALYVYVQSRLATLKDDERGQSTVEYAILIIGAALVAAAVTTWVSDGKVVGDLFKKVFDTVKSKIG